MPLNMNLHLRFDHGRRLHLSLVRVQASDSLCITKDCNKTKKKTNMDNFELLKALTMPKNKNVELEMCKIGPFYVL